MVTRLALFVASLTAALVLAAGLALGGLIPAQPVPVVADAGPASPDAPPEPTVQVDTVYLTPKVKPKHVTITRSVPSGSGEHEHEREGGGGD